MICGKCPARSYARLRIRGPELCKELDCRDISEQALIRGAWGLWGAKDLWASGASAEKLGGEPGHTVEQLDWMLEIAALDRMLEIAAEEGDAVD